MAKVGWIVQSAFHGRNGPAARESSPSPCRAAAQSNLLFDSLHVPENGWMRTLFQDYIRAIRKKLKEIQPAIVHGQGTEGRNSLAAVFSQYPPSSLWVYLT